MKGAPGLIAVVLDQTTQLALSQYAIHPNVHCSHVTMAYRPTPDVYQKYVGLMGKEVEFDLVALIADDRGQVAVVDGVISEKTVPHVTISCADGVQPSYSNQMLASQAEENRRFLPLIMRGRGKVEYKPLS